MLHEFNVYNLLSSLFDLVIIAFESKKGMKISYFLDSSVVVIGTHQPIKYINFIKEEP